MLMKFDVENVNVRNVLFWSGIHITAAHVSACLPVMRPAWTKGYIMAKNIMSYYMNLSSLHSRRNDSIALSDGTKGRVTENEV